jgi:hypothetical protein
MRNWLLIKIRIVNVCLLSLRKMQQKNNILVDKWTLIPSFNCKPNSLRLCTKNKKIIMWIIIISDARRKKIFLQREITEMHLILQFSKIYSSGRSVARTTGFKAQTSTNEAQTIGIIFVLNF